MMISLRDAEVTWRQVDDEIVVLDLATSRYLSLNGSAALLWTRLAEGPVDAAELASLLVGGFDDVTPDVAENDVAAFISRCRGLGLLAGG